MQLTEFSQTLSQIEEVSSRLEITALLAELYKDLGRDELPIASYLLQGSLVPAYKSLEFNLSTKSVLKALGQLYAPFIVGSSSQNLFGETDLTAAGAAVASLYQKLGDVGAVAEQIAAKNMQSQSSLSLMESYQQLVTIAQYSGVGSQDQKQQALVQLLAQCDPLSARFCARIVVGKLRLGFSVRTMQDALSWAIHQDKSDSGLLELAYQRRADMGLLAQTYLSAESDAKRKQALADYTIELGIPVVPALCQRLNSATEIIEKMEAVIIEPKYDGLRVQLHCHKQQGWVKVFSRSLEDITHMFPEAISILDQLKTDTCILDGEVIGVDDTGGLLQFSETIRRKRKHDVASTAQEVPIKFYIFDALYRDGNSLISTPLVERKRVINRMLSSQGVALTIETLTTHDATQVHQAHEAYLKQGLEGAVVKQVDSVYQSGRKGWSWVKIKESEGTLGKLADTLDLVVLGYYHGRGKRAQFGIGALLMAVRVETDKELSFETVCKVGTGLTEQQLVTIKQHLDELILSDRPKQVKVAKELIPDLWVQPELVLEIAADEITASKLHSSGFGLRFPRLIKTRHDKSPSQATSKAELLQIRRLSTG